MNFFGEAINWIGDRIEDVGDIIGGVAGFVAGLPNELVDLADRISAGQRRATEEARRQAVQFERRRLLGEYGPFLVAGAIALGVVLLSGKR